MRLLVSSDMQGQVIRRYSVVVVTLILKLSRTWANYWLESVIDAALGITLLDLGLRHHIGPLESVVLVLFGLVLFSFIEYCFHRWLFHGRWWLLAQGHSGHHADPLGYDALPFFVPPLVLLGLIGLATLLVPVGQALLTAAGIAFGYVAYGLSHFLIHHRRFRSALIRKWAAFHHIHHHHPRTNFGVTTPLWDILLGTRYVRSRETAVPQPGITP